MKENKNLLILFSLILLTIVGYAWFSRQPSFQLFMDWAQANFWLYVSILIIIKILAVVWPPLPGGLFTIGSIPIIGPINAFLADFVGGTIGCIIAYFLGRKYGYKLLDKLFDKDILKKIKSIKINKDHEIEAVLLVRGFTSSVSEAVSYAAGLLGIHFKNFIIGTLLSNLIVLPYFFLWENVISFNPKNIIYNLLIMLPAAYLFYKFKGRYLE